MIGRAYVAYFQALLVAPTRAQQTTLLRRATDYTTAALETRQAQEGSLDEDESRKCVRFLAKVALAREALSLTSGESSAAPLRAGIGERVERDLQEIVRGLDSAR